ncbi:MAG: ArsB/NhaD family transporter [Anaerolineales bacterium]|nr:ArsB/NhaD family transporter [Anaerolineales bacterium]
MVDGIGAVLSSVIFVIVFLMISFHLLHETAAALIGAVSIFLITYVGGTYNQDLELLTFEDAMLVIDWNVIFLIMGMMIFMAILSETNAFKWLAFRLYQGAKGNAWAISAGLILLTGFTSAFLNDVTAILLLVPLSIQIASAIGLNPLAIVIPEVLASNIGGSATLIGDPPSTIVGSHLGISFGDYLANMAPVALLCMIALLIMNWFQYKTTYADTKRKVSDTLTQQLASDARITNRSTLIKALVVAVFTFVGFFISDSFNHMPPGVVALSGAAFLIVWVRPDMHRMLHEVDWTTLLFFIGLFIVVGAMESTGAIAWIASRIYIFAGDSLDRAAMLITWVSGIASGIVANIPFTVAALPIADYLTANISGGLESRIIYWGLILGADLGGNATYLGSAPNIVALGLLSQAGIRMTFARFAKDGVPVTLVTLIIATIYLLVRY